MTLPAVGVAKDDFLLPFEILAATEQLPYFFFFQIMTVPTIAPITATAAIAAMIHQENPGDGTAFEGCRSPFASLFSGKLVSSLASDASALPARLLFWVKRLPLPVSGVFESSDGSLVVATALITSVSVFLHTVQVYVLSPSESDVGSFVTLPSSH